VLDAGGIGTRRAEMVAVEVREAVVVASFAIALDQLPMPETTSAASADARLRADDTDGQDVIAGVAELPIGTMAALVMSGVGDGIGVLTMQARDGVEASAVASGDLLEVVLCQSEGPKLAGVGVGAVRWVGYPCCVHEAPPRGPGPEVCNHLRGHFLIRRPNGNITVPIVQQL
jgi:hypothetical protein